MAVEPNDNNNHDHAVDSIFQLANEASEAEERNEQQQQRPRRTITMYRNGFVVDDGPYRRLEDPENADFLRHLAMGRTPRELVEEGDVTVNLVDKRSEEYVETFRSFSGTGTSLGTAIPTNHTTDGVVDPSTLASPPSPPPAVDESKPTTTIQVKLLNGQRRVVKINLDATVRTLAAMLDATERFRLVTGFPPRPLTNLDATIDESGLKGAQVMMQKV